MIASLFCLLTTAMATDAPRSVQQVRHFDVQHLDLDLTVHHEEGRVEGTATVRVQRLNPSDAPLRLHQVALDVSEITIDGAATTDFKQGATMLEIVLPEGQDVHEVRVAYDATPQTGLHFRGRPGSIDRVEEVWSQGEGEDNRHWFPNWDYPNDTHTVSTRLTVPKHWHATSNGLLQGEPTTDGNWRTWSYALEQPIVNYLVMVAAGEYNVFKDDSARVPLEYIVPSYVSEETARRTMGRTGDQLAFYEALLGVPYPYPIYRQVVVQRFIYGGMENASATILSDRLLVPDEGTPWRGSEDTIAHELVHQWYGDLLTCYGWRELWLNEGFATYYAWRWLEHLQGDEYAAGRQRSRRSSALYNKHPMAPRGLSEMTRDSDNASVYVRGASVLFGLEKMLGRDVFDKAIRLYTERHQFRLVETADLRRAFEDVSGQHLGWYFDAYVHSANFFSTATTWSWDDGQLLVTLTSEEGPEIHAVVPVEIGLANGDVTRQRAHLTAGVAHISASMEEAPLWVAVDPDAEAIISWDHEQSTEAWIAQLKHSPSHGARWDALDNLRDDDNAVEAVAALWKDTEAHDSLRSKAARTLGKIGTDEAVEALLDLQRGPDWQEQAVTDGLAMTTDAPATMRVLRRMLGDSNPFTRADALEALAALDEDAGLVEARRHLTRPDNSATQVVKRVALRVIGTAGDTSDLLRVLPIVRKGKSKTTVIGAARAAIRVATREDEPPYGRVARAVEPLLEDVDLRTRQSAVYMLGQIGDEQSQDVLTVFANSTSLTGLAASARDAARDIRKRPSDSKEAKKSSEEDLERMEQALDELEKRIEELERWR